MLTEINFCIKLRICVYVLARGWIVLQRCYASTLFVCCCYQETAINRTQITVYAESVFISRQPAKGAGGNAFPPPPNS